MASYAEMIINRYIKTAHEYSLINDKESVLIGNVEKTLKKQCKINIESKSDTDSISKMKLYFNFANYSILAGCVLVICLIISSFRDEKIVRRISVSSMSYRKHNRILLISSCLFAAFLWAFYVIVSFFIIGREVFSMHGLMYMINSFVFTFCAVTIAFLIANITNSKNAISGIVNVVALGSSFVCGCFVPMQWLPDLVKQVAHVLPSYWYVDANESLSDMSVINISNLNPVFIDMAVVIAFAIVCIVITNLISLKKVKNNR
jgi:ABC-2 type transport system permease protein